MRPTYDAGSHGGLGCRLEPVDISRFSQRRSMPVSNLPRRFDSEHIFMLDHAWQWPPVGETSNFGRFHGRCAETTCLVAEQPQWTVRGETQGLCLAPRFGLDSNPALRRLRRIEVGMMEMDGNP
jgi:hypothetical protein